jgi:hypothetical protein
VLDAGSYLVDTLLKVTWQDLWGEPWLYHAGVWKHSHRVAILLLMLCMASLRFTLCQLTQCTPVQSPAGLSSAKSLGGSARSSSSCLYASRATVSSSLSTEMRLELTALLELLDACAEHPRCCLVLCAEWGADGQVTKGGRQEPLPL